jgi:hypothetical protein
MSTTTTAWVASPLSQCCLRDTTTTTTTPQQQRIASSCLLAAGGGFGGNAGKDVGVVKLKPKQQWDRYMALKKEPSFRVAVKASDANEWLVVGAVKCKSMGGDDGVKLAVAKQRALLVDVCVFCLLLLLPPVLMFFLRVFVVVFLWLLNAHRTYTPSCRNDDDDGSPTVVIALVFFGVGIPHPLACSPVFFYIYHATQQHAKRLFPMKISPKDQVEWAYEKDDAWVTVDKAVLNGNDVDPKEIGFEGTPDPNTGFFCVRYFIYTIDVTSWKLGFYRMPLSFMSSHVAHLALPFSLRLLFLLAHQITHRLLSV